ncbi:phage tail protein [Nocardioides daphniae]|uniref:Phage tail protein n=1 Tax=Nocardioides daphniae TaxID=402297 RepID=A0A4P7UAA5_9ACTN|nr:tail fiber protein [Nocardioides daphniae]QCC76856.1 phage tail protein [Nocardioides daphniae]GGD17118.1 tail Collar domain-containing protein [Nocardioides daphniae]
MAEPFLSEVRLTSFNFPPKGWALCNGQLLPINQNQALFSLLGTTYGGDGRVNFALPNLRGRVIVHEGNGHTLGEAAGATAVTLNIQNLPQHSHGVTAHTGGAAADPGSAARLAAVPDAYALPAVAAGSLTALHPASVTNAGGSQAHDNMQPYTVMNYIIALQGIFPSQNW